MNANEKTQVRIYVPLTIPELKALQERARQECRQPRDQVRYILCQALGLHACATSKTTKAETGGREL